MSPIGVPVPMGEPRGRPPLPPGGAPPGGLLLPPGGFGWAMVGERKTFEREKELLLKLVFLAIKRCV